MNVLAMCLSHGEASCNYQLKTCLSEVFTAGKVFLCKVTIRGCIIKAASPSYWQCKKEPSKVLQLIMQLEAWQRLTGSHQAIEKPLIAGKQLDLLVMTEMGKRHFL